MLDKSLINIRQHNPFNVDNKYSRVYHTGVAMEKGLTDLRKGDTMKTMIETMTDAKIETLNKMAEAILGQKLMGWTITNSAVEVIKNGCWTTLKLVAVATNGQETTKFFYEAGRPFNQLAKFANARLG